MISFDPRGGEYLLLDPVAGDGAAIAGLRLAWWPDVLPERLPGEATVDFLARKPAADFSLRVLACEMEKTRAAECGDALYLSPRDSVIHADAFNLVWPDEQGAALLFLNPPYDTDRRFGRLEQRFLVRFGPAIAPGGALLLLVPQHALAASADYLAANFADIRAWRFPAPEFEAYHQVALVGRRSRGVMDAPQVAQRIRDWARGEKELPELPEECERPLRVGRGHYDLSLKLAGVDFQAVREAFRASEGQLFGTDLSCEDLIGRRFPTAMPPKPAHIALALAAGHFNGHRILPDAPDLHPPLLLKGVFLRELVEIDRKEDADGDVRALVMVEQPRLRLSALRLDRFTFFTPKSGAAPTGTLDVEEMNTADILLGYSGSLARLMARQFPPLHSPARAADEIALPALDHDPLMEIQRHAVQAILKLLGRGENPRLLGEVGTGKTRMTIYAIAAMAPGRHAGTLRELRRVGIVGDRLPLVRRALVVCPPHILGEWAGEVARVWPQARVVVLDRISDLQAAARELETAEITPPTLFVMSREVAKLGHGYRGVARREGRPELEARCPRCGLPVPGSAEENMRERRRCARKIRLPRNGWARLALDLAAALLPASPEHDLVRSLISPQRILRHRARGEEASILLEVAERVLDRALALMKRHIHNPGSANSWRPMDIVGMLARGLGRAEEVADRIDAAAADKPKRPRGADSYYYGGGEGWLVIQARERAKQLRDLVPSERPLEDLLEALRFLGEIGSWTEGPECGEPLYQAVPTPERFPLARYISRYMPNFFDLLVLDEAHEYKNRGSAQGKAAFRLVELGMRTLALTGSVNNGYASSLHALWWALDPEFRRQFARDGEAEFIQRFGFQRYDVVPLEGKADPAAINYGSQSEREINCSVRKRGEAPGVLPLFVLQWLLPAGVVVHKADLDRELPPCFEVPAPIIPDGADPRDAELLAEYERITEGLMEAVRKDRFSKRSGLLWGAMGQLPSYLDRCTEDLGPFDLSYPKKAGGGLVVSGRLFPASYRTPKERWLLARLREERAAGRKTIVFVCHTGSGLPQRLLRLIREEVTLESAWLDAKKVPTAGRQEWINANILAKGVEVLLVNPDAVRTGLNNLVTFSRAVWFELDYKPQTYRQANGRIHRIGQLLDVLIYFPIYENTAQRIAFDLLAAKVSASLQVDGLDVQSALEAAGAEGAERAAIEAMLSMGQAIYERLLRAA